jgi:hypothetical protein
MDDKIIFGLSWALELARVPKRVCKLPLQVQITKHLIQRFVADYLVVLRARASSTFRVQVLDTRVSNKQRFTAEEALTVLEKEHALQL